MHHCKLLVISCLDYRFQEPLRQFLNRKGYRNNYDLVCLAGGAGSIVSPLPYRKKTVFQQLKVSRRLHGIEEVYLINHQNCGAYGDKYSSGSQKERKKHERDLGEARKKVTKMFPHLRVFTFFIRFAKMDFARAEFTAVI